MCPFDLNSKIVGMERKETKTECKVFVEECCSCGELSRDTCGAYLGMGEMSMTGQDTCGAYLGMGEMSMTGQDTCGAYLGMGEMSMTG